MNKPDARGRRYRDADDRRNLWRRLKRLGYTARRVLVMTHERWRLDMRQA